MRVSVSSSVTRARSTTGGGTRLGSSSRIAASSRKSSRRRARSPWTISRNAPSTAPEPREGPGDFPRGTERKGDLPRETPSSAAFARAPRGRGWRTPGTTPPFCYHRKAHHAASIFVLSSAGIGSSTPALLRALARALTAVRNNPAPILSSPVGDRVEHGVQRASQRRNHPRVGAPGVVSREDPVRREYRYRRVWGQFGRPFLWGRSRPKRRRSRRVSNLRPQLRRRGI